MALIERSFKLATNISGIAVKQLQRLNGLKANIYFPVAKPSLYNDSSQAYEYSTSPDDDGRFLFTGIYGTQEMTGFELEGYSSFNDGDGKMYVIGEDVTIPRNSKVEVLFEAGIKVFRTQDLKIVNGVNGKPVYGVLDIVPFS